MRGAVLVIALLAACGDDVRGIRAIEPPACGDLAAGSWDPRFALPGLGGSDAAVYAMIALPASDAVVVGGDFDSAAGVPVANIAAYDGAWSQVGDGLPGAVLGLARDDLGVLWAIGTRDPLVLGRAYVARLDGDAWTFLAEDVASLAAIAVVDGGVAVGGEFNSIDDVAAAGVAVWDGVAWSGRGLDAGASVSALARDGTTLCAGGRFGAADSGLAVQSGVACLSGATWTALGDAWGGVPFALAKAPDGTWWGGGSAAFPGGNAIATLVDGTWQVLDGGVFGATPEVRTIVFDGDAVLVGGNFTAAGPDRVLVGHLASHTSAGWAPIVDGGVGGAVDTTPFEFDRGIYAIARTGTNLSFGGAFAIAGDRAAANVASVDGLGTIAPWTGDGDALGVVGEIEELAVRGGDVVGIGDAITAGAVVEARGAVFDGAWRALPPLPAPTELFLDVVTLADGRVLVVPTTGDVLTWDGGDTWTSLDLEATAAVADADGNAYLALANHTIVRWRDGEVVELGVADQDVIAMEIVDGMLAIGGAFATLDGAAAPGFAVHDGDGWRPLGEDGPSGQIVALAATPALGLVVAGYLAGGSTETIQIARWDGTRWRALGDAAGPVTALGACAEGVAVGGSFDAIDGVPAKNLAWYDGAWHALDRPGAVLTFAPAEGALYVGGAGGGASAFSVRTPARP